MRVSLRRFSFLLTIVLLFAAGTTVVHAVTVASPAPEQSASLQTPNQPESPEQSSGLKHELTGILAEAVFALKSRIDNGPPFLIDERHARIERLERLLADPSEKPAEKYRRVLETYRVELDYAKTVDAYRGVLRTGKDERLVDFLSIGRLALFYQTLDGHESGAWLNRQRQWQRLSGEDNESISQGLRTTRKLDPPQLMILPLTGPK